MPQFPARLQPEGQSYDHGFTVHEFVGPSSSSRPDQRAVLHNGYCMIKAAVSEDTEWRIPTNAFGNVVLLSRNSYVFNRTPPSVVSEKGHAEEPKPWNCPASEEEIVYLPDLPIFSISELHHIGRVSASSPASLPRTLSKRPQSRSPEAEPEVKKRRLYSGSLYHIIPQPHIHPAPFMAPDLPAKGKPFKKAEPVFIPPYTKLPTSDVRLGWLIPIRGSFNWDNCTSGELLDPPNDLPSPAGPTTLNCVSWTEASLVKFWDFLLSLRRAGSLGPLGVSFHRARTKDSAPRSSLTSNSTSISDTSLNSSKLTICDYIKVYHDASKTLYVRYALDIWQYLKSTDDSQTQKIRMLKGARLLLVDEVSKGILTL